MSQLLLRRILDALPQIFVLRLLERQVSLYQQALDHVTSEQPWTTAEAFDLLPHVRRALWEGEVRKAAIACQLKTRDSLHLGENCNCVNVQAKRVILTAHFVSGPNEFVRDAESRKQNAGANRWLNHHIDERLLIAPVPKLDDQPIYVNLLHGGLFPSSKKQDRAIDPSSCFLRFAVPAADSREYLVGCNWSAQELLRHYVGTNEKAAEPAVSVADRAQPVVKKNA